MHEKFANRVEGGRLLAEKLATYSGSTEVLVLALPHGGVPVGYAVTCALQASLVVLVVRKLGVPGDEELAMGASVASEKGRFRSEAPCPQTHEHQNKETSPSRAGGRP